MTLNFSVKETILTVNKKVTNLNKNTLITEFRKIFELNKNITKFLKSSKYSGFESDILIGKGSESSGIVGGQGTNPLLWELGHFCYFYEYHCFKYLEQNYKYFTTNGEIYDSFVTSREETF